MDSAKLLLGRMLVKSMPQKATSLKEAGMTLVIEDNLTRTERLMRRAILDEMERNGEYTEIAALHRSYWENRGEEYFELTHDNFETVFLPDCAFVFDHLRQLIGHDHTYNRLVEIGTGNGDVINYLHQHFPEIEQFWGIDLSNLQVEMNKKRFYGSGINFMAADGLEWIEQNGIPDTIYVTSRGVLEYFTEERLGVLLDQVKRLGPSIFVAIEPNNLDFDYERDLRSTPYGNERSFSHNYKRLFEQAGFELEHLSFKKYEPYEHKLVFILAKA